MGNETFCWDVSLKKINKKKKKSGLLVLMRGRINLIDRIVQLPPGEAMMQIDDEVNKYHSILGMDNVMEKETRGPTNSRHI